MNKERLLWLHVIHEAQLGADNRASTRHERYLAMRWLTTWSRSFAMVCAYAGLSDFEARTIQEQEKLKWKK